MIFINAGHHLSDSGHVEQGKKESEATMAIRDELKKLLVYPQVIYIPDDFDLRKSIDFVNSQANEDDLCLDLHLNSNVDRKLRGTECYYYLHKTLASSLSEHVAHALGIANRGAKPDTQSYVGSLGWLRKTKCKALVLECFYMTNSLDMVAYNPAKIAQGIKNFLKENGYIRETPEEPPKTSRQSALTRLIEILKEALSLVPLLGGFIKR